MAQRTELAFLILKPSFSGHSISSQPRQQNMEGSPDRPALIQRNNELQYNFSTAVTLGSILHCVSDPDHLTVLAVDY